MTSPTIMITGANRGIGLTLSRRFAEDGWQVLACCRNPDDASQLQSLASNTQCVKIHALDVTNFEQMANLSAYLAHYPIDILLSNAGIYGPKGIEFGEVEVQEWRKVFEVNTIAPLMLV